MRAWVVGVILFGGCAASTAASNAAENQSGDCRDSALSCFAPFECMPNERHDAADVDSKEYGCESPLAGRPTCMGSPEGQLVPFRSSREGFTEHWLTSACIPVTYDANFTNLMLLQQAVTDMNAVSCSNLCFEQPVFSAEPPAPERGEQRVHFIQEIPEGYDNEIDGNFFVIPVIQFEISTGRIFGAAVATNPSEAASVAKSNYLASLMKVSGIGVATTDASVNARFSSAAVPDLTINDIQAICKLYGTPPYCE